MSYLALYRKWRPKVFEEVIEQEHVVRVLKNSVIQNKIGHAYLFYGTRGTGKTTLAKIFSRAINCLDPKDGDPCNECENCKGILDGTILDVVEMDAASNNGVDDIRSIVENVQYMPSKAKYRVYILDEVHELSKSAENALLKTLEEPPEHVVFILATTDKNKMLPTIISRCQRFEFRKISEEGLTNSIKEIAEKVPVDITDGAAKLIARLSDGALRDGISILDQCTSLDSKVDEKLVNDIVGNVEDDFVFKLAEAMGSREVITSLDYISEYIRSGKNVLLLSPALLIYFRDLMIYRSSKEGVEYIKADSKREESLKKNSKNFELSELIAIVKELSELESVIKWTSNASIMIEASVIKICERQIIQDFENLSERLNSFETKLGKVMANPVAVPVVPDKKKEVDSKKETVPKVEEKKVEKAKEEPKAEKKKSIKNEYENWEEIIKEISELGRMMLYTCLIGTKAKVNDDSFFVIVPMDSSMNKAVIEKADHLEVISAAINKRDGKEYIVRCILETDEIEEKEPEVSVLDKLKKATEEHNVGFEIIDE